MPSLLACRRLLLSGGSQVLVIMLAEEAGFIWSRRYAPFASKPLRAAAARAVIGRGPTPVLTNILFRTAGGSRRAGWKSSPVKRRSAKAQPGSRPSGCRAGQRPPRGWVQRRSGIAQPTRLSAGGAHSGSTRRSSVGGIGSDPRPSRDLSLAGTFRGVERSKGLRSNFPETNSQVPAAIPDQSGLVRGRRSLGFEAAGLAAQTTECGSSNL